MRPLAGKVVLVTGAGRGIGRSLTLRFAAEGAKVAALARTLSELEATAEEADGVVAPIRADVADRDDVQRATAQIQRELGPVDIVLNNAAIYIEKPILETSPDEWEELFRVNVLGPLLMTQAILPTMLERKTGRIINICSTASHRAYPRQSAYVASKHALLGFTKVLAVETHGTGVRVHAISPGGVNTGLVKGRPGADMSQYMDPDEVAEMAVFLARQDGSAMADEWVVRRIGAEPFR